MLAEPLEIGVLSSKNVGFEMFSSVLVSVCPEKKKNCVADLRARRKVRRSVQAQWQVPGNPRGGTTAVGAL